MRSADQPDSAVPGQVGLLRELTRYWHKNLAGYIRQPGEREPVGLHLVYHHHRLPPAFDLHAEGKTILGCLTLAEAIAAFFHIALIGQLKYPLEGEAVALLLQRRVAKVDPEGRLYFFFCHWSK
jgi:hypothetical protein